MNRRTYLTCAAATGLVGVSGCLNEVTEEVRDVADGGGREFGEVVTHQGVEVAPTRWMTTDEITFDVDQGATLDETPTTGAEFLLTHLKAMNTGDHERELPSRSSVLGGRSGRNIRIYYAGEETSTVQHEDTSTAYEVDGVRLTPYRHSRFEGDAVGSVYPGTGVEGWIVAEITEGFDAEETIVEVELGSENELEPFEWVYSAAAEVSPEEESETDDTITEI